MKNRPLCLCALLWVTVLWLLGKAGVPGFGYDPPEFPKGIEKENVLVTGIVYAIDSYSKQTVFYLKQTSLIYQKSKSAVLQEYPLDQIKLRIDCKKVKEPICVGDLVKVRGNLEEIPIPGNPGQFHERAYYYARKIKWYQKGYEIHRMKAGASKRLMLQGKFQKFMERRIDQAFSEDQAGILKAMLLGEKTGMGQENILLFQVLGCSHILAISGLHLSILGGGLTRILRFCYVPPKIAALLSVLAMVFYGELTGSGASVVRAVIMFSVSAGALCLKRTYDFLSAAALAGMMLLFDSPYYLYDSSFLLSFGAILGLGIVHPAFFQRTDRKKRKNRLQEGVEASISVWYGILPLILYFFCQISCWGLLIGVLILPFSGVLLISGLFGSIFGKIFGLPGSLILTVLMQIGEAVQKLPGAFFITGQPKLWCCGLYYIAAAFLIWKQKRGTKLLFLGAVLLLFFSIPMASLKVTFLDVGQGDCACIQTVSGSNYLIDGGSTTVSNVGKYRIYPFLKASGIRRIQGIFVSHMDEDHVNGIRELLEMKKKKEIPIRIENLFLSRCKGTVKQLRELEILGEEAGCRVTYIKKGDRIRDGKLEICCLAPGELLEDSNESSQVLHVSYDEFDGLFTGDVEGKGERAVEKLLEQLDVSWEVLKVAHHGSGNSTGEEFLKCVKPQKAVISCGKDNPYGHPHVDVLRRLEKETDQIFLTYQEGAVSILVKNPIFSEK